MNPSHSRVRLTYDDFVHFREDGKRHELIDGEHFVTVSPNTKHQAVLWNLMTALGAFLDAKPIGRAFVAPFDVVLSEVDVVEPDLLYMSNARASAVLTDQHVKGVPELVVEIGSPSTRQRDETIKRHLYEWSGVAEYWFVDPDVDVIRVYRRDGERFAPVVELALERGDVLHTALLPDFQLPLARVFKV